MKFSLGNSSILYSKLSSKRELENSIILEKKTFKWAYFGEWNQNLLFLKHSLVKKVRTKNSEFLKIIFGEKKNPLFLHLGFSKKKFSKKKVQISVITNIGNFCFENFDFMRKSFRSTNSLSDSKKSDIEEILK